MKTFENFEGTQLYRKTREVEALFEERHRDRITHPDRYPLFSQLAPEAFLCHDSECTVHQDDFLKSGSPIVYMAPSIRDIENLVDRFKPSGRLHNAFLVDAHLNRTGVYGGTPFYLTKCFIIEADNNLIFSGNIDLAEHGITIKTRGDFWSLNGEIKVGFDLVIRSEKSITFDGCNIRAGGSITSVARTTLNNGEIIEAPPRGMWELYKDFAWRYYGIRVADLR